MSTESLIAAAQRALEAAESERATARAAEARAKSIADEASRAAAAAEAEAATQEKSGRGPKYRAAKEDAAKARARAEAARADAASAEGAAAASTQKAEAAEKRMAKFNTEIENRKAADAYRTRTLTAIGGGIGFSTAVTVAQKIGEGAAARKATKMLTKDLARFATGGETAKKSIQATLRAVDKLGIASPLTGRGLAAKAVIPGGISAALIGTSLYLNTQAQKYREAGQKDIADAIDTFALGERYAAVGLAAKGAVDVTYSALKKVGKPQMSVGQLAVVERARDAVGMTEALPAKAAKQAATQFGSSASLREAAKLVGATPGKSKAATAKAIAETAARIAEPATKTAQVATKSVGTLSTLRGAMRSVGSAAGKAATRVIAPLGIGLALHTAYASRAEAKAAGKSNLQATTRGLLEGSDFYLTGGLVGATGRAARTPEAKFRRGRMTRALTQPGGYAAVAGRRTISATGRRAERAETRRDGVVDAHYAMRGDKQVFIKARIMTAKERARR